MALELKLRELQEEYKSLDLSIVDDCIVITISDATLGIMKQIRVNSEDGEINYEILNVGKARKLFLDCEKELIEKGHCGKFAIVAPDGEVMIAMTESDALKYARGQALYVSSIGCSGPD